MTMSKKLEGRKLSVAIEGCLDTLTSPDLEAKLMPALNGVETLLIDLKDLAYISSAGLRVLVSAAQSMDAQNGEIRIVNANPDVRNIFKMTGLISVLGVE